MRPYRSSDDRIEGIVITFIDITARKRAELALRASEQRLRSMMDIDVVSVLVFDHTGTLIDANKSFLRNFGYTREEIAARTVTWRSMTPPEYIDASERQIAQLERTGRIGPYEKEYFRKDGSRVWMLSAGAAVGEDTIVEYCFDIMDRKQAEQDLREAKLYAETIIDILHEPIVVLTPQLQIRSANAAFFEEFHLSVEETISGSFLEAGGGMWDIPTIRDLIAQVLSGEQQFKDFEVTHEFDGLGTRVMLLNVRRLPGVDLILVGMRDITERKRAELAVRESEQRYRLLIENAREYAIFMLDPDGCVGTWNSGAQRIFGYTPEEIIGQSGALIFTAEDRAAGVPAAELEAAAQNRRSGDERWHIRKDGSLFWANGVVEVLRTEEGAVQGFVKVLRDNTERKQSEELVLAHDGELRAANAALLRANADLKMFAAAASHDMQEPLRMMSTYAQYLVNATAGQRTEGAATAARFLVEGAERMGALLRDLLIYTKVNAEEPDPEEIADLNQALAAAVQNLQTGINEHGAEVICEELPLVPGRLNYYTQVFQNLIDNAIKYKSNQKPVIRITAEKREEAWLISVQDNGVGIEGRYQDQVFIAFKRLHGRQIPGTGLGLTICQRVIERYGGRMWVESQPGNGSTFYLTLPTKEVEGAASGS